jgi:tRNA G18 (ribose-2'-O)-methylase SpoU
VKKNCDIVAKINLDKEVESLNASAAASIALYQLFGKKS